MLPAEDFHQKVLCFAAKVATGTLFAMQQINGGDLSTSEQDPLKCRFGRFENLEIGQLWLIYGEFGGLLPAVEELYQKVLCFIVKVTDWLPELCVFAKKQINGGGLSTSELDLPKRSFGRLEELFEHIARGLLQWQ